MNFSFIFRKIQLTSNECIFIIFFFFVTVLICRTKQMKNFWYVRNVHKQTPYDLNTIQIEISNLKLDTLFWYISLLDRECMCKLRCVNELKKYVHHVCWLCIRCITYFYINKCTERISTLRFLTLLRKQLTLKIYDLD